MHNSYDDIRDKIGMDPLWFDENAVPRYCDFEPRQVADIYADEVALVLITCQNCRQPFKVAFSRNRMYRVDYPDGISGDITNKTLHYGDPPNVRCCASGPTMNSEPRKVLEYWRYHIGDYIRGDWVRDSAFECDITPDWVSENDDHY